MGRKRDKLTTAAIPYNQWPYLVRFEKADGYKEWVRENVKGEYAFYKLSEYKGRLHADLNLVRERDLKEFLKDDPYIELPDDFDHEDPAQLAQWQRASIAHRRRLKEAVPDLEHAYYMAFQDKQDAFMFKLAWHTNA